MPLVHAEALEKHYRQGAAPVVRALDGVDLRIEAGERVVLLGRSGSGKSTLLHVLGGLDRPTAGRVEVAGLELSRLSDVRRAAFRAQTVGFVFQSFHLQPRFPAWENVALPLVFAGVRRRVRRQRALETLEKVGLLHRASHRPSELSGGEQQRVALARSLIARPRLLLCDEPTGNLDSETSAEIVELLRAMGAAGATIVLVTHDLDLAQSFGTRVLRMADGRILAPETTS